MDPLCPQQATSNGTDVFAVVLVPVMAARELRVVLHKSRVLQGLARRLWHGVGQAGTQLQCTELLHQLHTLALPLLEDVAEDVVLDSLNDELRQPDKAASGATQRFTVLWHLGRDLEPSRSSPALSCTFTSQVKNTTFLHNTEMKGAGNGFACFCFSQSAFK